MRFHIALSLVLALGAAAGAQAQQCPTSVSGHQLRSFGGGTLFVGPVVNGITIAPDSSTGTQRSYVNLWHLRDASAVTLVCRYQGMREDDGLPIRLAPGAAACRQTPSSFVCVQ